MKKLSIVALATAGAIALAGLGVGAANATPSQVIPGTVTLLGQHTGTTPGAPITSGSLSSVPMFWGITINAGCPAGYQQASDTYIFQNGVNIGDEGFRRTLSTPTSYGSFGLDGNPVSINDLITAPHKNNNASDDSLLNDTSGLVSGPFELRYYCEADFANSNDATDKYFDLPLVANLAAGTWSIPVTADATTTTLTATLNSNKTLTATATVADTTTAANVPTGTVSFSVDGSTTAAGTGTLAGGVATFTTAALANGQHTITASYGGGTGTGSVAWAASASTGYTVQVGGTPVNVTVTIPSGTGSLTLSGYTNASVNLGTATVSGSSLVASGTLPGGLTVTDSRQVGAAAWNLTGQDTDFATSTGSQTFNGGYLGWVPAVGTGSQGTAGPTVNPITSLSDTADGLKAAARLLATGQVTSSNVGSTVTAVGAQLNLAVPSQTPAGTYTSVLTLTLA